MRRKIVVTIMILVCFILQSTVLNSLAIASISPNIMVVLVASFGFMRGKKEGMAIGFFSGLIIDIMYGSTLGYYALLYMTIGYVNGFFKKIFYPEEIKLPIGLIAASDFLLELVVYITKFLFTGDFNIGYYLLHIIMPELVYTMLVTVVVYFLILQINQKLEEIEKRSASKFGD